MPSKAGYCVQSQLTSLSRIKEPGTVSYLFPTSWVIAMCFFSGNGFESFRFWELVNANMGSGDPGNQYGITKHGSSYYGKPFVAKFSQAENLFNLIFHAYYNLI